VAAVWSVVRTTIDVGPVELEGQRRAVQVHSVVSDVTGIETGSPS
jgi:hypothetical protein